MIELKTLANQLERNLNSNSKGIEFKIHSDMGEFKNALATRTEHEHYTNGVLRLVNSAIVPTQTLVVTAQSVILEIAVELPFGSDKDKIAADHRDILDLYFTGVRVEAMQEKGKTFSVSMTGALADTGTRESRPDIGDSMTYYVRIEYGVVENGLNSNNCTFQLDGVLIPYSRAVITNRPSVESNPYSNSDSVAVDVATSCTIGFDFQVPALSGENGFSEVILLQLLGEQTGTHELTVTLGTASKTYTVIFGQTDIVLEGVGNAGHNISLVEAAPNIGA